MPVCVTFLLTIHASMNLTTDSNMNKQNNYCELTLVELRSRLKQRGIRSSGRKKELVQRLISLDALGIGANENIEPEYRMILPDHSTFSDINDDTQIPKLPYNSILNYFLSNDKSFEQKFRDIYQERFIRFIRLSRLANSYYLKASVWAEMRKSNSYLVDIFIDEEDVIAEAQCECGAGQGPTAHCKHVGAVLWAYHQFEKDGCSLFTEVTCTQKLQTFHQPKQRGVNSPLKAVALSTLNYTYDPRPDMFKSTDSFQHHFRSTLLNSPVVNVPCRQLYKPANTYAVHKDHDYLKYDAETRFLMDNKIETITTLDRESISTQTLGQTKSKEWHKQRKMRITASRFGNVCKAVRKDLAKLAASIIQPKTFTSAGTSHGIKYESAAIRRYEAVTGYKVNPSGVVLAVDKPYIAASPDGVVSNQIIVEVKCPYSIKDSLISPETINYLTLNNNQLSLVPSHDYYYQIQGQMYCTGATCCDFILFTLKDFKVIRISRDDSFIDAMVAKLDMFYTNYFRPALVDHFVYYQYHKFF